MSGTSGTPSPNLGLSPPEVDRVARATRAALRGLLERLRAKLIELEPRPEPWPAKWTAFKLSAQRTLEEQEAAGTPTSVIAAETARAVLAEMRRLEQADGRASPTDALLQARWQAMKRWFATRAVLHDR